jgi:hypothetical protein
MLAIIAGETLKSCKVAQQRLTTTNAFPATAFV